MREARLAVVSSLGRSVAGIGMAKAVEVYEELQMMERARETCFLDDGKSGGVLEGYESEGLEAMVWEEGG